MQGGVVNFVQAISTKLSNKIEIHHLFIGKSMEPKTLLGGFFKPLIDAIKLLKKITKNQYDVIHLNPSLGTKSILRDGLFMLIINMKKNQKSLIFFHGWEESVAQSILNNDLLCFLMRKTYGKAKKIIVLAEKFTHQLIAMGMDENQLIQLSTMFDGEIFNDIKKQSKGNKIILLFMSRFVATKGVFELIDAFNEIQTSYPEVTLHLVGDGPEKSSIEKKISNLSLQDNIKLLGYIEGREKAQELINADIFILPSYSEGCPISLLEAMAAGLPVIATDVGGIPNIITNEKNGVLLTSHSPNIIKKGIVKMLDNKKKRKEIGELNKKISWENYESKLITSRIEKIYKQISSMESI